MINSITVAQNHIILASIFITSLAIAIGVNIFLMRYASHLFRKALPENTVRFDTNRKPAMGGISFFVSFLFGIIAYLLFFNTEITNKFAISAVIVAVSMGFVLGLYDDLRNSPVWVKLVAQVLTAVILISSGISIDLFHVVWLDYLLTVLWVVGIMNSINMLDNMDGITTIVSSFILLTILIINIIHNSITTPNFVIILAVYASLIGFMRFNISPAKIYMGDVGSQFLGVILAIVGILYFWNCKDFNLEMVQTKQIAVTLVAFVLPITDTVTVFYKRIRRGQSPFVGGRDHTTHHLVYIGLSVKQIDLIFAIIGLISTGLILIILEVIQRWEIWHFFAFLSYFIVVFGTLFYIANLHKNEDVKK
jgi:UDP-GlcNAc:undecaprenyl-phosphate/decaprenyl-phosphate GlcNAc-1-phosphate transferase